MLALFVALTCGLVVISILDTQMLQYAALRNTVDYDRARYLAEAGVQHALAFLEEDFANHDIDQYDIGWTDFPDADSQYCADLAEGANGTVIVTAWGRAGQFTRSLQIVVKMGG